MPAFAVVVRRARGDGAAVRAALDPPQEHHNQEKGSHTRSFGFKEILIFLMTITIRDYAVMRPALPIRLRRELPRRTH